MRLTINIRDDGDQSLANINLLKAIKVVALAIIDAPERSAAPCNSWSVPIKDGFDDLIGEAFISYQTGDFEFSDLAKMAQERSQKDAL